MGDLPTGRAANSPEGDNHSDNPENGRTCRNKLKELLAIPGLRGQVYAALALSVAAFVAGVVEGWPGSISLKLSDPQNDVLPGHIIHTDQMSTIFILMLLSAMVHMSITGYLLDRFGRRAGCWFFNLLAPSGWAFLSTTKTVTQLYIGAALIGSVAISGENVGVIYISEISNDKIRGPLISLFMFFNSLGIFSAHVLTAEMDFYLFHTICMGLTLAFPVLFWRLPESPVYLMMKSRPAEARDSVNWYHGNDPNIAEAEMKKLANSKQFHLGECKTLLGNMSNRRAISIVVALSILSELVGTSLIEVFAGPTISQIHLSPISTENASLILAACRFFGGILNVYFVERVGRKSTLVTSLVNMGSFLTILFLFLSFCSVYMKFEGPPMSYPMDNSTGTVQLFSASDFPKDYLNATQTIDAFTMAEFHVSLISLTLYTLANQMFLGTTEVLSGEILAADSKGAVMAVAGSMRILTLIICVLIYNCTLLIDTFGSFNFLFNSLFCFIGAYVASRFVPETQGKTLNEIQKEMDEANNEAQQA